MDAWNHPMSFLVLLGTIMYLYRAFNELLRERDSLQPAPTAVQEKAAVRQTQIFLTVSAMIVTAILVAVLPGPFWTHALMIGSAIFIVVVLGRFYRRSIS